jgi:cytoskeletal protein CcmA (bactofilin family)
VLGGRGREREAPLAGLLGRGVTWTGDLRFEGRVRVDGTFSGTVYTDDVLEVGEGGRVEGTVDAATLIVAGVVDGVVHARDRVRVEATGTLLGEVVAANLEVVPGARIRASVKVGAP